MVKQTLPKFLFFAFINENFEQIKTIDTFRKWINVELHILFKWKEAFNLISCNITIFPIRILKWNQNFVDIVKSQLRLSI